MYRLCVLCASIGLMLAGTAAAVNSQPLTSAELLYADVVDDAGIVATLDSGLFSTYQSEDLKWWRQRYAEQRQKLAGELALLAAAPISKSDAHALQLMRASLSSTLPEDRLNETSGVAAPTARCETGSRDDSGDELQASLYACFEQLGNNLLFEGQSLSRDSAIAMLSQLEESTRRKQLFLAFEPLWRAVNGDNTSTSPYRRWLKQAAPKQMQRGSDIDAAGRDLEVPPAELEHWLERILDAWRETLPETMVEPWDYRYMAGDADRQLARVITPGLMLSATQRYYRDLGADPVRFGVLYDLEPRPGKAPVTYANYITMGRMVDGNWRPTTARISANYSSPGLYVLNMLVHETGHAVHYHAIRNRPAFMDIGDNLLCESFADVTSWDVYDPAWQQKYLGLSVSRRAGLRSQYTMVTLEAAWALFDLRMLRDPEGDLNLVWSAITSRYFHIVSHPELSWWAQRVQLVTTPGFMVNYGLGAVITADVRAKLRESVGRFSTGNLRWYAAVSGKLLRWGDELNTADLMRRFLGRPASPKALLAEIRSISGSDEPMQAKLARAFSPAAKPSSGVQVR